MKARYITLILILVVPSLAGAARIHPESWYQARWCEAQKGKVEYLLPDRTRCDCLTETHAVEVEFADKWTEAVGQSLYYALQTDKRAGIVLIIEDVDDYRYWVRLNSTIQHFALPIDVWMVLDENVKLPVDKISMAQGVNRR